MKTYYLGICALALWPLSETTAHADFIFNVSMDTSNLTNYTAPYGIAFDLTSGFAASSNTATIRNFDFGGGSPSGSPGVFGNASGSLSSPPVTLEVDNPTNFFSYFDQGFTPGNTLSFQVDLTTNPGSTPDTFSFYLVQNYTPGGLLSGASIPIPTTNPNAAPNFSSFLDVFTDVSLDEGGVSGGPITYPSVNGDVPAPQASVVPEPSTLMLSAMLLASLGLTAACRRLWRLAAVA